MCYCTFHAADSDRSTTIRLVDDTLAVAADCSPTTVAVDSK